MQLISPGTRIDFVRQTGLFMWVSLGAVLASIGLMIGMGFELGVDFRGGTQIQVGAPEAAGVVDEGVLRQALGAAGITGSKIQRYGDVSDRNFLISLPVSLEDEKEIANEVLDALNKDLPAPLEMRGIDSVGPTVGAELRNASALALLVSAALILVYVWFRFDLRYAPGAVAALIHDVVITAGLFVLFRVEFDQNVVAALLVVMGYSLNDTIVIYDRIRENLEVRGKVLLEDVVNESINQTLSRTLLTSLTTLIVIVSILVLGGPELRDFALALVIGVTVGTYSTVYIASALLILLEKRFGGGTPQS